MTPVKLDTQSNLWNDALIHKYNMSGPRYTSYPTALQFRDNNHYSETEWLQAVTQSQTINTDVSLYFHIPYCDTVCYYCGCNKIITANRTHAVKYLSYLKKEISQKAQHIGTAQRVTQIHFGGGTPTYLSDEQLEELLDHVNQHFNIDTQNLECAIEIHPQTVNAERLERLRKMGFNRTSLGVQDFNPDVQKAVNRFNSKEEVSAIIDAANRLGFQSTSIDLIYGLPLQTPETFAVTLNDIIELDPDRLSLFNYAHMPHMFKTQRQIDTSQLPEPQEKLQILHQSIDTLRNNGYRFIGMDHFAKHSDELSIAQDNGTMQRNFQGYATGGGTDLHGFGLSSISVLDNQYAQNIKQIDQYYQAIDDGKLPLKKGYVLNRDDEIRRKVINTLMCDFELNNSKLNEEFGIDVETYFEDELQNLQSMQQDGLIEITPISIRVHTQGRLLIRSICQVFDAYSQAAPADTPRYSRII